MKQALILWIAVIFMALNGNAQTVSVTTLVRDAEKNYHAGQYSNALAKLDQAQKIAGKTGSSILYWRILTQRALLPGVKDPAFYTNMKKFEELELLRENCSTYLKNYGKLPVFNKQSDKVYQVQLSLKGYPVAKVEFDEIMHLQNAIKSNQ